MSSISSLIEAINDLKMGDDLWYRGHSNTAYELVPSIWRSFSAEDERNMFHKFRTRAVSRYPGAPHYREGAAWVSLMQHYGLPTRLLDWTNSPLVALYFALEKYVEQRSQEFADACIWVLDPYLLNQETISEKITPSIESPMIHDRIYPIISHSGVEKNDVVAVMTGERDFRMFVQQSSFTIHSYRDDIARSDTYLKYLRKITIEQNSVQRMSKELIACGFRRGNLFPDLQNLAAELVASNRPNGR